MDNQTVVLQLALLSTVGVRVRRSCSDCSLPGDDVTDLRADSYTHGNDMSLIYYAH